MAFGLSSVAFDLNLGISGDSSERMLPGRNIGLRESRSGLEPTEDGGSTKALEDLVFSGLTLSGFLNRFTGGDRALSGLELASNFLNFLSG